MKTFQSHVYLFLSQSLVRKCSKYFGSAVQCSDEEKTLVSSALRDITVQVQLKIKRFEKHLLKCNDKKTNAVQIVSLSLETFQNSVHNKHGMWQKLNIEGSWSGLYCQAHQAKYQYSREQQNWPPKNRSLIGYSSPQHDPMIKCKGCSWKFMKFSLWWALKFSFMDQRELRK